jgi:hypothetical protein
MEAVHFILGGEMTRYSLKGLVVVLSTLAIMAGCEPQRAEQLVEGVSTEADVKRLFGEPKTVTVGADGTRTLDYPRQPEGYANYVMIIGTDGKLTSLRQLLNLDNFSKIQPGMQRGDVYKVLGPHAKVRRFELKKEELIEWRFRDGQTAKLFGVTFDPAGVVKGTAIVDDQRDIDAGR